MTRLLPSPVQAIVFALVDPRDSQIHFVGTIRNVTKQLTNPFRRPALIDWLRGLRRDGLKPRAVVLDRGSYVDAANAESYWSRVVSRAASSLRLPASKT